MSYWRKFIILLKLKLDGAYQFDKFKLIELIELIDLNKQKLLLFLAMKKLPLITIDKF